jgi:hypothetical protein
VPRPPMGTGGVKLITNLYLVQKVESYLHHALCRHANNTMASGGNVGNPDRIVTSLTHGPNGMDSMFSRP